MPSMKNLPSTFARYARQRTYQWNYDHAPDPVEVDVPEVPGEWRFCGLPVASPLGVPAGPLLCGRWVLYYASLGFDVLTYKTVRSGARPCYSLPNLQPVVCGQIGGSETQLPASDAMQGSWAVSFGMPSAAPDVWRADVEKTRRLLPMGKLLVVSVVGTVEDGWGIDELADDYARCARWAVESGADCIETNFSCPNVSTRDGQLFQQLDDASLVAARVRDAIGPVPLIVKVGRVEDDATAQAVLDSLCPAASALAMTNSIATTVSDASGELLFDGQRRGICGDAIRTASMDQLRRFARHRAEKHGEPSLIGVGGASTAEHVRDYLAAGAESVHLATAAMVRPEVGLEIRAALAADLSASR